MRKERGERRQTLVVGLALVLALGCTGAKLAVEKEIVADTGGGGDAAVEDSGVAAEVAGETATLVDLPADTPAGETAGPEVAFDLAGDASVQPDVSSMPDHCCSTDDDCDESLVCIISDKALELDDYGVCLEPPPVEIGPGPPCWTDDDCLGGVGCVGAVPDSCSYPDPDAVEMGVCLFPDCCANDADCDEGFRCDLLLTSCIPIPGEGECWYDSDCSEGKSCAWANLCPCQAPGAWSCQPCRIGCDGPDKPGSCVDLYASGCCLTDEDCNSDNDNDDYQEVCVGYNLGAVANWGVCVLAPVELVSEFPAPPPCWLDDHCNAGESCYGAGICGCLLDCDMAYEGPGFCGPADTDCMPIEEDWVLAWCDAANLVIFNGEECVATGFGCCHCGAFCQFTYQNVAECQAVCGGPFPFCEVFDGGCDDAIPEEPWWYWDGSNCLKEDTCVCEGCPGTFMSLQQCLAACVD